MKKPAVTSRPTLQISGSLRRPTAPQQVLSATLWSVVFDKTSTYDAEKDLDIDVRVNSRDRTVFVRFINGKATFGDLAAELEANSAFDAMFEVKVDTDPDTITGDNEGKCGSAATKMELAIETLVRGGGPQADRGADSDEWSTSSLNGGISKVAIQVTFNAYIEDHTDAELLADVLNYTVDRAEKAGVEDANNSGSILDEVQAGLDLAESDLEDAVAPTVAASYPATKVTYTVTTSSAGLLPQVRDLVTTVAGSTDDPETTDFEVPQVNGVDAPEASVALGYADDAESTKKVREDQNARSQVRIGRSSSVKAPE